MAHPGFENASQGQWARRASLHELSGSFGLKKTHITRDKFQHKSPTWKFQPFLWWFPLWTIIPVTSRWNVSNIAQPRTSMSIDHFPRNKPTLIWGTSQHACFPEDRWLVVSQSYSHIFPWYSNSITMILTIKMSAGQRNSVSPLGPLRSSTPHRRRWRPVLWNSGGDLLAMAVNVTSHICIYRERIKYIDR